MLTKKDYKYIFSGILFLSMSFSLFADGVLKGRVYGIENEKKAPLPFAHVFWLDSKKGTTTDSIGFFSLPKSSGKKMKLVVSFVGYTSDTLDIASTRDEINISLQSSAAFLNSVNIIARKESSFISKIEHQKSEVITTDGLQRLACCNLAESFENSASVDVGYSDAVSGARQIQMLGLSGVYSQLMLENIPFIRGLSAPFGLNYVPGSFMEGIQISKGVSSVLNGYESMTGQINLEYRKPKNADPLFMNFFLNNELKGEVNVIGAYPVNDKLSTMVLAHGSWFNRELDHTGHDGFMDTPKSYQINIANRWFYDTKNYKNISFINYVREGRTGGQMGFDRKARLTDTLYGIAIDNQRLQFTTKNGLILNEESSVALQLSGTYFEQTALYGRNDYSGEETNLYANLLYENTFSGNNKLTVGSSMQINHMQETFLNKQAVNDTMLSSKVQEQIPGVFAQFATEFSDKVSIIAGMRYDYHSVSGNLFTPRLHFKWNVNDALVIRAVGGKGYRTPYILSENFGAMASSRRFIVQEELKMEDAWNYGVNLVKDFPFKNGRRATFTMDVYRTDFLQQVIVDLDKSAGEVSFYNLDGQSFSNNIQADLIIEALERFHITLAGRYNDVKQTVNGELKERPYVSKWKGLLVLSYATLYDKWIFDLTTQLNGSQRLPNTNGVKADRSDPYFFMLGQVTRKFKHLDIYAGCENITNFVQKDPIIAANQPFGPDFDASVIYAPTMGRMFYIGLRWTLQ